MIRMSVALPLLAAFAGACVAQAKPLKGPIGWTIRADDAQLAAGKVQLELTTRSEGRSRSSHSRPFALSALEGLTPATFGGGVREVAFRYVQPAGRLDCDGVVRSRAGAGECRFSGNAGFVDALVRRGIGRPDEHQLYHLALSGADLAVLDELERQGYPKPDLDGFVKLGIFGVTPAYVRELASSGYRLGRIDDLVEFKIFKVTPQYIAELAAAGPQFRNMPARKLVEFRIHKVSPEQVRAFAALGFGSLDRDDLTRFSIFKVTPEFVRELRELGYRDLTADELVKLRIHGVTPEYIRGFERVGGARPNVNAMMRMRMAGVDPARRRAPVR